jgi:hypothetical protein
MMLAFEDERPFFLLLRPFRDEPLMRVPGHGGGPARHPVPQGRIEPSRLLDLAETLAPEGMPIVLGDEKLGVDGTANPFFLEVQAEGTEWFELFQELALASRAIFVFPSSTEGISCELSHLSSQPDLLGKTLVVMPPTPYRSFGFHQPVGRGMRVSESWAKARQAGSVRGLNLPEYHRDGMLYVPNPDFSVREHVSLERRWWSPNNLARPVRIALQRVKGSTRPLRELAASVLAKHLSPPGDG